VEKHAKDFDSRLCDLALMSIEWDEPEKTDFDEIVDEQKHEKLLF